MAKTVTIDDGLETFLDRASAMLLQQLELMCHAEARGTAEAACVLTYAKGRLAGKYGRPEVQEEQQWKVETSGPVKVLYLDGYRRGRLG